MELKVKAKECLITPSLQQDCTERFGTATDCRNCEYRSIRLTRSEIT